jgi:hypothetical protein
MRVSSVCDATSIPVSAAIGSMRSPTGARSIYFVPCLLSTPVYLRDAMRSAGCLLALFLLTGLPAAHAQSPLDFRVSRVGAPPTIDGDLSDEAWLGHPLDLGQWVTYNPHRGEKVPIRTDVRIVYDSRPRLANSSSRSPKT